MKMIRRCSISIRALVAFAAAGLILSFAAGCNVRQGMYNQPKVEPYEASSFFADGMSARPLVAGTVARGLLRDDDHFYLGRSGLDFVNTFPHEITPEVLDRGEERFNIYCAPCHDKTGSGLGMIPRRGFKIPTSLHIERLQNEKIGYFYHVMSNGFGVMPSYSYQVPPEDRWAIAAWIRVLQRSQVASMEDVPEEQRAGLLAEKP